MIFSVSGVVASDVNDALANDGNDTSLASDENDFVVSNDIDDMKASSNAENQPLTESNTDDGTFTSLQLKILSAGDGSTVSLYNDYKYNDDFKLTTGIFINKDITIDGNGHSIDAMGKSRIFNINYGIGMKQHQVTLKNINFKNGHANIYGGAILNFAHLTVDHCTFTGNNAGTAAGAINSLGVLNLKNSVFNRNSAGGDAGAVFSLTFQKSQLFYYQYFEGRNATEDSNLLFTLMQAPVEHNKDTISNKDLFIRNSQFKYNTVSEYGGAVYFRCHEVAGKYVNGKWVPEVKFYNNLIESSTFLKNVAKHGGAIYGFKYSASDKIHGAKAVKCTFEENKAQKGRDVYGGTTSKCTFIYYKVTLKKAAVKKSAKKLVLKATLKKGKKVAKGKKVTFKFKGKKYTAKTNKKGIAKVTIKKSVLKKLKVGKKVKYTATYKAFSGKVTAKKTVKVKK